MEPITLNFTNILQIIVTLFVAWTVYNNKVMKDKIVDLKDYVEKVNGVLFKELSRKQDVTQCTNFHDAHKDVHALEGKGIDKRMDKQDNDINKIGKIARNGKS